MEAKKFYSAIRRNLDKYIPDWAKDICEVAYLNNNECKRIEGPGLKIMLTNPEIKTENNDFPEFAVSLKEIYKQITGNGKGLAEPEICEKFFEALLEEIIREIWNEVLKSVFNFSFYVFGDEETLEDFKKNNIPYFEFRNLYVAYRFTLNSAPDDILIVDNTMLDSLHVTMDMLYEFAMEEIENPESELLFGKGQAAIYNDMETKLERDNMDEQQIKSAIHMARLLDEINAYFVGFKEDDIASSNITLSEYRLDQIAAELKCRGFYVVLLNDELDLLIIPDNETRPDFADSVRKIAECWDKKISDSVYYYNSRVGFLFDINETWCNN